MLRQEIDFRIAKHCTAGLTVEMLRELSARFALAADGRIAVQLGAADGLLDCGNVSFRGFIFAGRVGLALLCTP